MVIHDMTCGCRLILVLDRLLPPPPIIFSPIHHDAGFTCLASALLFISFIRLIDGYKEYEIRIGYEKSWPDDLDWIRIRESGWNSICF